MFSLKKFIKKNRIQENIYDNMNKFKDLSIDINQFDLTYNIQFLRNPIPGMHFLLAHSNHYEYFLKALYSHEKFKENLKIKNNEGGNIWHIFFGTITLSDYYENTTRQHAKKFVCTFGWNFELIAQHHQKQQEEITAYLLEHYPEGLLDKNNAGQTPYEAISSHTAKHIFNQYVVFTQDKFEEKKKGLETINKFLLNFNLQQDLKIQEALTPGNKI